MVSCIRHIFQSADLQREDGQSVLRIVFQNIEYKLPCRRIIDKMLADMHNNKIESVKEAVNNSKAIALASDFGHP